MSGLEVAGLILGAFPLAIEILDRHKEVARRLRFWYKIAAEHKRCDSQLKFHQLVYITNLKRLLLPLAGLDDTRIDVLLRNPSDKAWTEAGTARLLEQRLGDSHELYMDCMSEFRGWLQEMNNELAFDPETKQQSQKSSSAKPVTSRSIPGILIERGKWGLYRFKFSQAEKDRDDIFAKLQSCNDRLKTLLQISEDNVELARERLSTGSSEANAMCRFWRQACRVFTALSMVWNCNCRAQHSTRLLLEHRTSTTSDFQLFYDKFTHSREESRRIRISAKGADLENSAAIQLSPRKANVVIRDPNHRVSIPKKSALKKATAPDNGETRSQPSVTITRIENSSAYTIASPSSIYPITNLCLSLERSDSQFCGFMDEDDYRYYVYQEASIFSHSDLPKKISLDQLLRKDGLPTPKRRQRVALAFILSSSFLQLLESPWLPTTWHKSDVIFFEDPSRPGVLKLDEPHLKRSLDKNIDSYSPSATVRIMQLSSLLEMLGVVLLELCFGEVLEDQSHRLKYPCTGHSITDKLYDMQAAKEWHGEIEEEAGSHYSVAVGWCFGGIRSTPPERWRETMLGEVVNSLESCHRYLQ